MYKLKVTNKALGSEYVVEERTFITMEALVNALSEELLGGYITSTDTIQIINLNEID